MKFKNIDKKELEKLAWILGGLIVLIIAASVFDLFPKESKKPHSNANLVMQKESETKELTKEEMLENKLEKILSTIQGVKNVEVMITLETTGRIEPAFNKVRANETTQENDANGGKRVVTTENVTQTVVTQNNKDGNEPILLKSFEPEIKGVIIVAQGAEDIVVKDRLFNAVKTVLQVNSNKVEVYPRK